MDQVARIGAHEVAAPVLLRVGVARIHGHPRTGRQVVVTDARAPGRGPGEDSPRLTNGAPALHRTDLVEAGLALDQGLHLVGARSQPPVQIDEKVGVPFQVAGRQHHVAPRHPLVADEAVEPLVEGVPELEGLGGGLEPSAHGIEAEIPGAQ